MDNLKNITKTLKALSDEGRLRILSLLNSKKDLCVCEIKEVIGLSQPTISSHLKVLEGAGLVKYAKDGRWINYNINKEMDREIKKILDSILLNIKNNDRITDDSIKLKKTDRKLICFK